MKAAGKRPTPQGHPSGWWQSQDTRNGPSAGVDTAGHKGEERKKEPPCDGFISEPISLAASRGVR